MDEKTQKKGLVAQLQKHFMDKGEHMQGSQIRALLNFENLKKKDGKEKFYLPWFHDRKKEAIKRENEKFKARLINKKKEQKNAKI